MSIRIGMIFLAVALLGCNGPVGLLPGGKLDGESKAAPSDWTFAGDYGYAELETRPDEPYSVNLVYTIVDGSLYINAGDTETHWVKNIDSNANVRFRLEDVIYELRAERVEDANELTAFAKAWTDQSMFRRDPSGLEEVWIYRLVGR